MLYTPSWPRHIVIIQKWYKQYNKSNCFTKSQNFIHIFFVCRFSKIRIQLGPWTGKTNILWKLFLKLEWCTWKSSKIYKVAQDKKVTEVFKSIKLYKILLHKNLAFRHYYLISLLCFVLWVHPIRKYKERIFSECIQYKR